LQALYQFLLDGTCPATRIHVVPHLVMRSNLDLFLERLPVDLEDAAPSMTPDRAAARRGGKASASSRGAAQRFRRPAGSRRRV
jgi:hypothetical protein